MTSRSPAFLGYPMQTVGEKVGVQYTGNLSVNITSHKNPWLDPTISVDYCSLFTNNILIHSGWLPVNCSEKFTTSSFICETNHIKQLSQDERQRNLYRVLDVCNPTMVKIKKYCVALTHLRRTKYYKMSIAFEDDVSLIEHYISSWTLYHINKQTRRSRSIHVLFHNTGARIGCLKTGSLFNNEQKKWFISDPECKIESVQNSFQLIMMSSQMIGNKQLCRHWEFQCTDGTCIHARYICDLYADCLDSSDEKHLTCGEMYNLTTTCIGHGLSITMCHCPYYFIRCMSGECIHISRVCDSTADCNDNSDELICIAVMLRTRTEQQQITTLSDMCPNRWSLCNIYSNECFPNHMICVFIRSREGASVSFNV